MVGATRIPTWAPVRTPIRISAESSNGQRLGRAASTSASSHLSRSAPISRPRTRRAARLIATVSLLTSRADPHSAQGAQAFPAGGQAAAAGMQPQPGQPAYQQPQGYGPGSYQQVGPPAQKKRGGLIALLVVVGIVLAGGIGWGAATFFSKDSEDPANVASTDEPTNAVSDDGSAAASDSPEPTETESALPDDPKKALKQLADSDGQTAKSELNGKWVPQLSSKRVGLEAEGKTWDEESILEEFEGLREEYPA